VVELVAEAGAGGLVLRTILGVSGAEAEGNTGGARLELAERLLWRAPFEFSDDCRLAALGKESTSGIVAELAVRVSAGAEDGVSTSLGGEEARAMVL
jgi:hypothetical protein